MTQHDPIAEELHWWEFQFVLRNRVWSKAVKAHPLALLRALLLGAKPLPPGADPVFKLERECALHTPIGASERLDVTLVLPGAEADALHAWQRQLATHIQNEALNFELLAFTPARRRTPADFPPPTSDEEVCLHFLTPFAYGPGALGATLPFERLREAIQRRLARAWPGKALKLPARDLVGEAVSWRMERRLVHESRSNGGRYALTGRVGRYVVRGDIARWWPWLKLAELLHLGKRIPFGLGRFRLEAGPDAARLGQALAAPALRHAYEQVVQHHDTASAEFAASVPAPFDPAVWCEALADNLRSGQFDPGTYEATELPKPQGGVRRIEQPPFATLVVATHLHELLEPMLDRQFEPESYGFRKGRSREDAARAIDAAIDEGYRHVIETDIAEFFPSVPHDRLAQRLAEALPTAARPLLPLIQRLIAAPWRQAGVLHTRPKGLPQGLPLSPLLANLFLDPLDEWLARHDVRVVRYADDLVVLCRDRERAEQLLAQLNDQVQSMALSLAPNKTRVTDAHQGFSFLGFQFPRADDEPLWKPPLRRALHIFEPHLFLGVSGDALELRQHGALHELIPLRRIDRILLHAPATLSTALIRRASAFSDPVTIAAGSAEHGQTMLLTLSEARHFDVALAQAQRHQQLGETAQDAIARDLVEAKIRNAMVWLRMRYRPEMNQRFATLEELIARLPQADDIDAVRGLEGMAAREVFAEINIQIDVPEFRFRRRARDERDRINPLFNFGYWLLFQHLNLELRALGLNPYLGFLHRRTTGVRYEALVCDLQEPFRCVIDRLLVRLVNLKAIRPAHVSLEADRPRIASEALKTLTQHFERELQRPLPGNHLTLADAITAQCLNLRDFLTEGRSFHVFRMADARRPRSTGSGK